MSQIANGLLGIVASGKKKEQRLNSLQSADRVLIERLQQFEADQRRFNDIFFDSANREAGDLDRIRGRNVRSTSDITADRAREVIQLNNANAAATGNIRSGALLEANAQTFSDIFNTVEQEKTAVDFGLSTQEQGLRDRAGLVSASFNDLLLRGSTSRADIQLGKGRARTEAIDDLVSGGSNVVGGIVTYGSS